MNFTVKDFSGKDEDEILLISDNEFGKNFIDNNYLKKFLNSGNAKGIVALVENEVIGFSFFQWLLPEEIPNYILASNVWLKKKFKGIPLLGYRNLMAVKAEFQNRGVGKKLVEVSTNELKKRTNVISSVVWKNNNSVPIEKLLTSQGFLPVKYCRNYWKEDSKRRNYSCIVCGIPPCTCSAEIYLLNMDK